MASTVSIDIMAQDRGATRTLNQATQSLSVLDQTARATGGGVNALADEAQRAQVGVTNLGRGVFSTSAEAKKFSGVFRDSTGQLREANGQYAKTTETVKRLGNNFDTAGRGAQRMGDGFGGAGRGAGNFSRVLGTLGGVLAGLGIVAAADQMVDFARASARASIQLDSATRALGVLVGGAAEAEAQIREVQELADEPGLRFQQAIDGTVALRAIGTEAETTTRILKELANAAAFSGGEGEFERGLLGFRQIIQRGRVSQEELNQLTENLGLASRVIREEFGTVLAEDIQKQLDEAGQTVDDFVERVLTGFERLERFPIDAASVRLKNLSNSIFEFSAAIGDRFLPVLSSGAVGLTNFLDSTTELLNRVSSADEVLDNVTESVSNLDAAFANTQPIEQRNQAIENYISVLESARDDIQSIVDFETGGGFNAITSTATDLSEERAQIGLLGEEIEEFQGILQGSTISIDFFEGKVADLGESIQRQQSILSEATRRQTELAAAGQSSSDEYSDLNNQIIEANNVITALRAEHSRYNAIVAIGEENLNRTSLATNLLTLNQEAATEATEDANQALLDGAVAYAEYVASAARVRQNLEALSEGQSALNDFWRIASGQVEDYAESIETVIPRIINLTQAEDALTAAIDANLNEINPIIDGLESWGLTLTSVAELQSIATAEINLVNPAISDAVDSLLRYIQTTNAANGRFETLEEIQERIRKGISGTGDAFDNLRGEVNAADVELDNIDTTFNKIPDSVNLMNEALMDASRIVEGLIDHFGGLEEVALQATDAIFRALPGGDNPNTRDFTSAIFDPIVSAITTGNPFAIADIPFNIHDAFQSQDQRREARIAGNTERDFLGDLNLERIAAALDLPVNYSDFDFTRGNPIINQSAIEGHQLPDDFIAIQIASLVNDLDRAIEGIDIQQIFQPFVESFETAMTRAGQDFTEAIENARSDAEISDSFQGYLTSINSFFDTQIEAVRAEERATGVFLTDVIQEIERARATVLNEARELAPRGRPTVSSHRQNVAEARALAQATGTDTQAIQDVAIAQYGADAFAGVNEAGQLIPVGYLEDVNEIEGNTETVDVDRLNEVIQSINEDVALINASITSLETQIDQASEPSEIAELLSQVPELIREKYQQLRDALEARFTEGEISEDVYNASLTELQSSESAELERNSDAQLANTLRIIDEDVAVVNASITAIETQIAQLSDPVAIAELLSEIPQQIREKYTRLREALNAKYAAGEISDVAYTAAFSVLESSEASEIEQHSDALLANTLQAINEDVHLVDASITTIHTEIAQLSDPEAIATLLAEVPALIREKYQKLRESLGEKLMAGEISEDVYNASLLALESSESSDIERNSDAQLANTLQAIDEDAARINASVTDIHTQIAESNDPEAIAELLSQIPSLITEKYRLLREALDEKYADGEISADVYTAAISELESSEASELESHSDEVLANALRAINEDVALIDASITSIQTEIAASNEPEAIAALLARIPALITEKYRKLREALNEKYAAGEINTDVYNASLAALESSEAAAIEKQSDAELANALKAIDDDVSFIDAQIGSLEASISASDDPEAIAGFLETIKTLVMDKYKRLRERLQELRDAEEISDTAFNAAILSLDTAEGQALAAIDTQALTALRTEAQEKINFINGSIENLRLSLQLTEDPAQIQQILETIKTLTRSRFQILRDELEAVRHTLSAADYQQAIEGLNLSEQLAIDKLDTEKFAGISAEAQEQVEFINTDIENLRLALQVTDDPAERQQLLETIEILTTARFDVLRDELEKIKESLSAEEYERALKGLNLSEQLSLENLDTEKFSSISAEARKQVDGINGTIENLRLALALTDDSAERQQILDAIKILTANRFDILIQELKDIQTSLDPAEFEQAFTGLQLGKELALESIDTEKFAGISEEAARQVAFINGSIENLRLSLELTDDPVEVQQIIETIKVLTVARFQVLREELEAIRTILSPEDYQQALTGLNLSEQLSLENLDTEKFAAISEAAQKQIGILNGNIENLRLSLQLTDDPAKIQQILESIKILTRGRFAILRKELEAVKETLSPEAYEQTLQGLRLGETLALDNLDTEKFSAVSSAAQAQVDFVNGAISNLELALQLTDDPAEVEQILNSIKTLIAARFDILIQELRDLESSLDPAEFAQALEGLELGKAVALQGLDDRIIGVQLTNIGNQIVTADAEVSQLFEGLESQTTVEGVREAIARLRTAIENRYDLMREKINAAALSEEEKAKQFESIDFQEGEALSSLGDAGLGQFDSLISNAQFLLDNTTESEFGAKRDALIDAINTFYDERIRFIEGQDLSDTDRRNLLQIAEVQRDIALNAVPEMHANAVERLEIERDTAEAIEKIEAELAETIADINEDLAANLENIESNLVDKRKDITEDLADDLEDIESNLVDKKKDINSDLADDLEDIEKDLAEKRKDINSDLADDLENIESNLVEKRKDITEDLADDIQRIDERLNDRISDNKTDLADDLTKIQLDLADDIEGINSDLADDLQRIDERLADNREGIAERLNDSLSDLAADAVDAEEDRLGRIQDLHRDHQASIEEIRLRSVRRQEDIELGLNRRIADIQREAARDISELEDDPRLGPRTQAARRQEAVADIQREVAQRIEDARLRATRARADLETDAERRRADLETDRALSIAEIEQRSAEAQAEILEQRAEARQASEEAHQEAIADAEKLRIRARQASEKSHQEAIADAADARVRARQASEAAHQKALADAEKLRVRARQESEEAHQEALAEAEESRIEARQASEESHQEALADAEESRIEVRQESEESHQKAIADAEEARIRARQESEESHQEALADAEEARVGARQASEESHQRALADAADARLRARQESEEAYQKAIAEAEDARIARIEANRESSIRHQRLLADIERDETRKRQESEEAHRVWLADIEMDRQSERLDAYASALLDVEDLIDQRYSDRVSLLTRSIDSAFSEIPNKINIDFRLPEKLREKVPDRLPEVQAIPAAPVPAPQNQPNPAVSPAPNGGNPATQPQANRPTQINLTIDNSRRVGSNEIKDIHRETVIIEDDGRVVI